MTQFLELTVLGVLLGMLYALVALGFVVIAKATGVVNFAQGELVMLGGYLAAGLMADAGLAVWIALPITVAGMVVVGLLVERLALRPLANESLLALVMVTIALAPIMRGVAGAGMGTATKAIPPVFPTTLVVVAGLRVQQITLWAGALALVFMVLFAVFFRRTRLGLAMQAISDDRLGAQTLGVDIRRINAAAWAVSGAVSALGGFVWGTLIGVDTGLAILGLSLFPVVILGGVDSILGTVVGGVVVGVLQTLAGGYIDPLVGGGFNLVAPLVLLVAVLMIRPYGLFGRVEIERV